MELKLLLPVYSVEIWNNCSNGGTN